jgi:hypothetical protein
MVCPIIGYSLCQLFFIEFATIPAIHGPHRGSAGGTGKAKSRICNNTTPLLLGNRKVLENRKRKENSEIFITDAVITPPLAKS